MNDSFALSAELQTFLREKIPSYEHLQSLLLLRGQRYRTFSLPAVAESLRVPETAARLALDDLCSENLLGMRIETNTLLFQYSPGNAALADLADQLAEAYDVRLLDVMQLMSANAIERMRTKALHTFANAFLVGKRRKNDG